MAKNLHLRVSEALLYCDTERLARSYRERQKLNLIVLLWHYLKLDFKFSAMLFYYVLQVLHFATRSFEHLDQYCARGVGAVPVVQVENRFQWLDFFQPDLDRLFAAISRPLTMHDHSGNLDDGVLGDQVLELRVGGRK